MQKRGSGCYFALLLWTIKTAAITTKATVGIMAKKYVAGTLKPPPVTSTRASELYVEL